VTKAGLDVSALPEFAFGARDPMFWGTALLIAIETTMIAMLLSGYFYLRSKFALWPPAPLSETARWLGAGELLVFAASAFVNLKTSDAASRCELFRTRRWLAILSMMGLVLAAGRVAQFATLGFRWDANAYASMVYALVGLHATHLLLGVGENFLFLFLMYRGPIEKKFMVDVYINSIYWYFVVGGWLVTYVVVYLEPLLAR
jgi:cytochrome c oxidase subunit III